MNPRVRLLAAFAAVYLIWGSTYLAIRYAIGTIPPFAMAGVRFLIAGALVYGWTRARGAERPTRKQWTHASVAGLLLLLGGNGAVVWAEQRVSSGVAALLVAVVPLWMVLLDWLRPGGHRPRAAVFVGLLLGLVGLVVLVGPSSGGASSSNDPIGAAALVIGSLSWAMGSLYSHHGEHVKSPLQNTGMQMLAGGVGLIVTALATGELSHFDVGRVSGVSLIGLAYLITFGSLVGFTAYSYLLHHTTAARAATYAYVNPIVAVILGWAIAGERITAQTVVAAAVILAGVAIITTGSSTDETATGETANGGKALA